MKTPCWTLRSEENDWTAGSWQEGNINSDKHLLEPKYAEEHLYSSRRTHGCCSCSLSTTDKVTWLSFNTSWTFLVHFPPPAIIFVNRRTGLGFVWGLKDQYPPHYFVFVVHMANQASRNKRTDTDVITKETEALFTFSFSIVRTSARLQQR